MKVGLVNFLKEESGQDLVEYALLLALITVVVASALGTFGTQLSAVWQAMSSTLSSTTSGS